MPTVRHLKLHFCALPLPRSLSSAIACITLSYKNAHCISLLLWAERSTSHNLIPPLYPLWTLFQGWSVWLALTFLPSHLPGLAPLAHLYMFQCMDLSDMFVYWARNFLLNYSYLNCWNLKERSSRSLTHHSSLIFFPQEGAYTLIQKHIK